jgi:hypothetical protein
MAADQNFTLYRLYGDFEGTGAVSGEDFTVIVGLLGRATNATDSYVDYDGDGVIGGTDFTAFVTRLGHSESIPNLPSIQLLAAPVLTAPVLAAPVLAAPAVVSPTPSASTLQTNAANTPTVVKSVLSDANPHAPSPKPNSHRRHR